MERQAAPADNQATIAIAQSEGRGWNRRLAISLLLTASFTGGYILSPGSFLRLMRNQSLPSAVEFVVQISVAPLSWAPMKFPIVASLYDRYFELIGVDL